MTMLQVKEKVAVVGGSGFIGSQLARALLDAGIAVTIVDISSPPRDIYGSFSFACCDVARRESLCGLFSGHTTVFLLAASLAKTCCEDPSRGWATNVLGTANVLDALRQDAPEARVVFTSTGGIYALDNTYPLGEDAPIACRGLYAASKLAGEEMVRSYSGLGRASSAIFRFFTVYGPGPACGKRGHFIASWIERIQAGQPLTVHGDGSQTVDLTHVSDVVHACQLVMRAKLNAGSSRTYNIGSGTETAVLEVAHWMQAYWPSTAIVLQPAMSGYGPARQLGDIRRAQDELGYTPRVGPHEGIRALLREQLSSPGTST